MSIEDVLLRGLIEEYGEDRETWTEFRSLRRIARAIRQYEALKASYSGRQIAAEALREAAEDLFYNGCTDEPMPGYDELHERADRIARGDA